MNENAKKKARQRELLGKIKEKYDKAEELTVEKKEVLNSWIKNIDRREAGRGPADEKEKSLVLKLARQIEEREAKKARK
jgi:hypothetical protein